VTWVNYLKNVAVVLEESLTGLSIAQAAQDTELYEVDIADRRTRIGVGRICINFIYILEKVCGKYSIRI
jgi:hypothetical protein